MTRRIRALLAVWALLSVGGLATQLVRSYFSHAVLSDLAGEPLPSPRLARRLVVVLFDALRYDTAFRPDVMPSFNRLAARGASGMAWTGEVPMTGIGVRTIGTGVTADLLDIVRNWDNRPVAFDHLFRRAHEAGRGVAFIGDEPWAQLFGADADFEYVIPDQGMADLDESDPKVWQVGLWAVASHRYDIVVVHFVGTDHTGHRFRSDSPEYAAKARQLDGFLAALEAAGVFDGDTALCVLSDHGSAPNGNHGSDEPEARRTPFLLAGSGVAPARGLAISQLDYAATFAALLGLPYPAPAEGRIAVEALALPAAGRAALLVDNLRQRLRYLHAYAARFHTMADPSAAPLRDAERALARGDSATAAARASESLRMLEAEYVRSLYAAPLYPLAWIAIVALVVCALFLVARASAPPPASALAAIGAACVLLGLHELWGAARLPLSLALSGLHAVVVLRLARLEPRLGLRPRLAWGLAGLAAAWEAAAIVLYVDAPAWFARAPRRWLQTGGTLLAAVAAALALRKIRAILAAARRHPAAATGALLLALGSVPTRAEIGVALAAVLALALCVRWPFARAGGAPGAREGTPGTVRALVSFGALAAVAIPYAIAWLRLGWMQRPFRLPGPAALRSPAALATAGALLSIAWVATILRSAWANPRARALRPLAALAALDVALALLALAATNAAGGALGRIDAALVNACLYGSAGTAALVLLAPAAAASPGPGPAPPLSPACARASLLAVAAYAPLLVLSRDAQVALLPATLLLAEWLFGSPVLSRRSFRAAAVAAALLVLLRLLIFGFTEGRFYFSAIDVKVGFAGAADTRHLPRAVVLVCARFLLPFVVLALAGLRRLDEETRGRALLLAAAYLGARMVHMALLYRLSLHHFWIPYTLVGELAFTFAFAISLGLAHGLWGVAARSSRPRSRRARRRETATAEHVEPRAEVA